MNFQIAQLFVVVTQKSHRVLEMDLELDRN